MNDTKVFYIQKHMFFATTLKIYETTHIKVSSNIALHKQTSEKLCMLHTFITLVLSLREIFKAILR